MARTSGQITIAAVGKLKSREWQAAQQEYLKRLTRYSKMQLVEVKDSVGRGFPDSVAVEREGKALLKAAAKSQRIILLSERGRQYSSPELAAFLRKQIEGYGRITFLIGGPIGFSDQVIAASHTQLALSRLTFTHEMARVLLLEQVYRAFTILRGEKYHK